MSQDPTLVDPAPLDPALVELVAAGGVVVLSGAGMSTASGIPDYRGPTGRARTRPPMRWDDFADSLDGQRRYWLRGIVGWRRFAGVRPNVAHRVVAGLEEAGLVDLVVTQNVDGLHQAAGSRAVVELHGSLAQVVCMACGGREDRAAAQDRHVAANPWVRDVEGAVQADGDAVVDDVLVPRFTLVGCTVCGGGLRPDVVFFGEFVPRDRVVRAREAVEGAATLLVLGSSLAVGSGYLLVRRAVRHGTAVAIVNAGPTRGDPHAHVRCEADLTALLPALHRSLGLGVPVVGAQ